MSAYTFKLDYVCSCCGARNVKLWRQTFLLEDIRLTCAPCTEKDQEKPIDLTDGDQCGWRIPAVPVAGEDTFWGYTSVPDDGVRWWKSLPTRPSTSTRVR